MGLTLIDVWDFSFSGVDLGDGDFSFSGVDLGDGDLSFSGVDLGDGDLSFTGVGVRSLSGAGTTSSLPGDTSPSDREDTLLSLGDSVPSLEGVSSSLTTEGGLGA